jgi:hypothetical protein
MRKMTIPEDMMTFIEETARKAAREGAKEVVAERPPVAEHEAAPEELPDVQKALHWCRLHR